MYEISLFPRFERNWSSEESVDLSADSNVIATETKADATEDPT